MIGMARSLIAVPTMETPCPTVTRRRSRGLFFLMVMVLLEGIA
jgi:hypothetical protein